jgi:hypothetical protein
MPDGSLGMAAQDAKAAKWDEVAKIKKPEYYTFHNVNDGKTWMGTMVVDRHNGMVYVSAHMQ